MLNNHDQARNWGDRLAYGRSRFTEWLREGFSAAATASAPPISRQVGPLSYVGEKDPWPLLMADVSGPRSRHRMFYGVYGDQFLFSAPYTNSMILGPVRTGKTGGILVPIVLSASGPTLSTSVRKDVLRTTAATRARLGQVWHLCLDGSPAEAGTTPLRYSFITKDWRLARRYAKALLFASETNRDDHASNASYFANQGARLVAPTLMAAAYGNQSMAWVTKIMVSQSPDLFIPVQEILAENIGEPGVENAADTLAGVLGMPETHGSAADIFATAGRAFETLNEPAIAAVFEAPNFDPAAFVAGQPAEVNPGRFTALDRQLSASALADIQERLPRGKADSIFITADGATAKACAPVIVPLLAMLHEEASRLKELDDDNRYYDRPPMTWALDEMANMAPWDEFPEVLATAAGSNVLITAVFHDMSQIRAKWGDRAGNVSTNMHTKIVYPGIADVPTLEALVAEIGGAWMDVASRSEQSGSSTSGGFLTGTGGRQWGDTHTVTQQRLPMFDTGMIKRGNPDDPSAVLVISRDFPEGHIWAHPSPYYSAAPWPEVLVGSLCYIGSELGGDHPQVRLPVPILDKDSGEHLYGNRSTSDARWLLDTVHSYEEWRAPYCAKPPAGARPRPRPSR